MVWSALAHSGHYQAPSPSSSVSPDYAADSHFAYYQEYYSFFPPFPFDNYFHVKNWEYGGSTMIFENYCRLTPDLPDRQGFMWSEQPVNLERWEAIFALKIGGKGKIFGDGLAFWWTKNRMRPGPIFGNEDRWEGLGVFLDTYDNNLDNRHPYLSAFWNDGTVAWDHDNDGGEHAALGCKIKPAFRNKNAIQVVVSFFIDRIQILVFDEATEKWYDCLNMTIPKVDTTQQYFGFTASTGAVSDNHDILSFEVYDMKKMADEGVEHEHVDPSSFASFDDPSFIMTLLSYLTWLIGIALVCSAAYLALLLYRTKKDKKKIMP
jgi:mannose-binding lectin 2